jgi:glutathione S-transferase
VTNLTLYYAPTACCDAPLIALEHLNVPYELRLVRFAKGDHRKPEYVALNPMGKVPLLLVDGKPLTENVAILTYLAKAYPQAGLLPFGADEYENAKIVADLAWVASGLHPLVTRLFMPSKICDLPEATARVKAIASEAMRSNLDLIEQRLADRDWIYGAWSALDAYLFWVHNRLEVSGFDLASFPRFRAHAARMLASPAVQRAWAKRAALQEQLKAEGVTRPAAPVNG